MKIWLSFVLLVAPLSAADGVTFANEGVINAPIAEVWKVLSTSDGYRALGPAKAAVDLRVGGSIRTHYRETGRLGDADSIENTILAYEPPVMMAIRIQKPPRAFPFKEAWKNPWTVITLAPLDGDRTKLRVASLGYGSDEESLAMKKFFEVGNQMTIESIQRHFAKGGTK